MGWYTARVLLSCEVAGKLHPYEESYLVVQGDSPAGALRAAKRYARREAGSYRNPSGETVVWKLVSVLEVQEVLDGEISDGTEVYSRRLSTRAAAGMLARRRGRDAKTP